MSSEKPLFRKLDNHLLRVADLDAAISFYRDRLGHRLLWRSGEAAGFGFPETDAELVVHLHIGPETDILVADVDEAFAAFWGRVDSGHIRHSDWPLCANTRPLWQRIGHLGSIEWTAGDGRRRSSNWRRPALRVASEARSGALRLDRNRPRSSRCRAASWRRPRKRLG
jgi:catechol 2,3-dioxygenase-like lactoylglutathione lyase family enzyme